MRVHPILASILLATMLAASSSSPPPARADCGSSMAPTLGNVSWGFTDSLSACPAGDTVFADHPARLRVSVIYEDANCNPRSGVPPESIWVTTQHLSGFGNLKVNDQGPNIYADDSTDAGGFARVTIPSFSGCGKLRIRLYVSGVNEGYRDMIARTTDPDADGRTETSEGALPCDLNYKDGVTTADAQIQGAHVPDWHRNALFGTMVRRTNLSYAEGQPGAIGESQLFWSPSGRWLSYTIHGPSGTHCHVFIVPSDPAIGNTPKQFTWFPDTSDYDPSWSPLNTEIAFARADYRIVRKGIAGLNPDTLDHLVAQSGDSELDGDLTPAISPNGQWVAFGRKNQATYDYHIWKARITGGSDTTQLTYTPGVADQYPNWSPDGEWLTFDREIGFPNEHHIYRVKANQSQPGDTLAIRVYSAGQGKDAATPTYSPDGLIVTGGIGTHDTGSNPPVDVMAHTLDPGLTTPRPILNFPDTSFAIHGPHPVLSARVSPDGTRPALRARQVWAARRNMNLPPAFTNVVTSNGGNIALNDTTALVEETLDAGMPYSATVSASDPEGDALTYDAFFLKSGMSWDASARTLSWALPGPVNSDAYLKFRCVTESGGTDSFILRLHVRALSPSAFRLEPTSPSTFPQPNPSSEHISFGMVPQREPTARLVILDIAGRRIRRVSAPPGSELVWDGKAENQAQARSGIYLYRLEAGQLRQEGKIVIVQ